MKLHIPELSLVAMVGTSGSGKSTFARSHFLETEIVSSDRCRALVCDDETNQEISADAFDLLYYTVSKRLSLGKLTVIDATNVQQEGRKRLIRTAREHHVLPVAIVLDMPRDLCYARNENRPNRDFGPHVIRNQYNDLRRSIKRLKGEGFRQVYVLRTPEDVENVAIVRDRMWTDYRHEAGPFDLIGDVHGCFDELVALLGKLGYAVDLEPGDADREPRYRVSPPESRRVVFLGDLVDRGPASHKVLRLAMDMVDQGVAFCVPGNHEAKLSRKLRGANAKMSHGLAETMEQLETESDAFRERVVRFIDGLVSHMVLDSGRLVVAHAGMKEAYAGRASGVVRSFALFGETTGETDEYGLPVRYDWARDYRGKASVVYGHTPVRYAEWLNRTICIDTGCVFGGKLTALRWPERDLVEVPAKEIYYEPVKPLEDQRETGLSVQQQEDRLLNIEDVLGKRLVSSVTSELGYNVMIREEHAMAAMETLSRFAVDPRWLIYLPPTMAPSETSKQPGYLEHPAEALAYYRKCEVPQVVCEEKHMGSRAVIHICRDAETARRRFGVESGAIGVCYTRTGRSFFARPEMETELLERLGAAMTRADLWSSLNSDWFSLDCELMPWSAKGLDLLKNQYGSVACAANVSLAKGAEALKCALDRGVAAESLAAAWSRRAENAQRFHDAYQPYCWRVDNLDDLRLAPFHLLASEGGVHADKSHEWHMRTLARLAETGDPVLTRTRHRIVDLEDAEAEADLIRWWTELTEAGGEGMVVKPMSFVSRRPGQHLIQPAVKCRGRAYLRIIYGPDYDLPENLARLRQRRLHHKQRTALREFVLGIEGLTRFVRREPLRRVHECSLGVLALESQPVDPRL